MEQKVVGIDLEIERRMKEKAKDTSLPPISPIKEDKELIEQLELEIAALQQKCRQADNQAIREKELKEKEALLLEK